MITPAEELLPMRRVVRVQRSGSIAVLTMECGHTCSTGKVLNRENDIIPCLTCARKSPVKP